VDAPFSADMLTFGEKVASFSGWFKMLDRKIQGSENKTGECRKELSGKI